MEGFIPNLAQALRGDYFNLFVSLVLAGIVLIMVNTVSASIIDRRQETSRRKESVVRRLRPVLGASADLLSRFADILLVHQNEYVELLQTTHESTDASRVLGPIDMNRFESTAFRLINFLAESEDFRRKTADSPSFRLLDTAEYFLAHKIPMGFRGNLYAFPLIATEVQEEIAASFLALQPDVPATNLSVGQFCKALKSDVYDKELFERALKCCLVDTEPLRSRHEMDRHSILWRHILSIAHLSVYLIDFFQELANNCQWEEHRLFYVRLIKHWNKDSRRDRYLYKPGDLSTSNYLDTYPGRVLPPGFTISVIAWAAELLGIYTFLSRGWRFLRYTKRGQRFRRRHETKTIRKWGIRVRDSSETIEIRFDRDLQTVTENVMHCVRRRLV